MLENIDGANTAPEAQENLAALSGETNEGSNVESGTTENDQNTEEGHTSEAEAGEEQGKEDDSSKRPSKGFEKRIERFQKKIADKDQEIEYWRRAAMGKTPDLSNTNSAPQNQPDPSKKPIFADYNDLEAYTEAVTDWKLEQKLNAINSKQQQQNVVQTYQSRVVEFAKTAPDFMDVIAEFQEDYSDVNVPEIVQVALESEVGPQLAYYLAKNTHEVDRLANLPSHRRLIELGKLEDKVGNLGKSNNTSSNNAAPKVDKQEKVSKASAPLEPVKGTGKVQSKNLYDDNLDYAEWVKIREQSRK